MPQPDDPNPFRELSAIVKLALGPHRQKELAHRLEVDPSDVSHALRGRRALPLKALDGLANYLGLDLSELVLLRTLGELRIQGSTRAAAEFEELVRRRRAKSVEKGVLSPATFLCNWRTSLKIGTVIAADRREHRPVSHADCLAQSGSVADLFYLPTLFLPESVRIRSDKVVKVATPEKLATLLDHDVIITSSPSANYGTRMAISTTMFPFSIDQETFEAEQEVSQQLAPIAYQMDELAAYMSDERNARRLNNLLNAFAKPGFVDPINFIQARGSAARGSMDFGIVTFAKNPWAKPEDKRLAIVLAGVRGPATAAAIKLLSSKERPFDKHPFGGVFRVSISNVAPWEDRYDLLNPEWDTHDYTIEEYESAIKNPNVIRHLPGHSNAGQLEVIAWIKDRCPC